MPQDRSPADARIPLVFGVAGHGNIHPEAVEDLKKAAARIFRNARARRPHTPLALVSALAEGADRLVAEVALAEGVELVAVVTDTEGREVPASLLERAAQLVEIPPDDQVPGQQWERAGAYVARHAQILIALWDGVHKPESGTSRLIRWQQEGHPSPFMADADLIDSPEGGPIWQVPTRRAGQPPLASTAETLWFPPKQRSDHFERGWDALEDYNRVIPGAGKRLDASRNYLLSQTEQASLQGAPARLFEFYGRADAAAIYDQGCTARRLRLLFGLGLAAVVAIEIYAHLTGWLALLGVYLVLLLAAFGVYWHAQRQRHQQRYLDHRALAEALRVQLFWWLGGVTDSVADHYLRQFRSELDWIRQALRTCQMMSGAHRAGALKAVAQPKLVRDRWIEDQSAFFHRRARQRGEKHHAAELASRIFFAEALVIAALAFLVHWRLHHASHELLVAMFLSLVVSACYHGWTEKEGDGVDARRYEWAASVFQLAAARWDAATPDRRPAIIHELGREALSENADWVVQHRQRPLAVVRF